MELNDFDYHLPPGLIAQYPPGERGASRLMVLYRHGGEVEHRRFIDITSFLKPGDLLILNDTKVMPARLVGRKETGGRIEVLLVERKGAGGTGGEGGDRGRVEDWRCLAKPGKGLREGARLFFDNGLIARFAGMDAEGLYVFSFAGKEEVGKAIERLGKVPLPPYIRREPEEIDREMYQTVYAEKTGAVAAPTAGLHFTEDILREIRGKGVTVKAVTLHTGPGTFMPVKTRDIKRHTLIRERYRIGPEVFEEVVKARRENRRVIAAGTTTVRALESAAVNGFEDPVLEGSTGLFIYPGFSFKAVDALLTNFHLPKSTLLMLVSAFAGYDNTMRAYAEAVRERYRFFSYGDAMFIV